MISKLIEGKLVTLIVGSVFRVVEILLRALHLGVRGVRLLVQEVVTSRIDRWLSTFGKRRVATATRVDDSSIVLVETTGEYAGDPKYIAEEILRRRAPYRITWVLRDQSIGPFPREFHFVRDGTADCVRAIARAKVVIQNGHCLQQSGVAKGPRQHWLQTGPGSLGQNSFAGDRRDLRMRRLHNAQTDFVVTDGTVENDLAAATYWPDVPTLMLGHARTDVLLDRSQTTADVLRKKVLDRLAIPDTGQKFLLLVPAAGTIAGAVPVSGIDVAGVRAALSEKFDGTWEILILAADTGTAPSDLSLAGLPAYCHNASSYPDATELLAVAHASATDRARWSGDFLLTSRPSFVFSMGTGVHARPGGMPHDTETTPLTVATSNQELLAHIERFDHEVYDQTVAQFRQTRSDVDDGGAAARIVDRIEELMGS